MSTDPLILLREHDPVRVQRTSPADLTETAALARARRALDDALRTGVVLPGAPAFRRRPVWARRSVLAAPAVALAVVGAVVVSLPGTSSAPGTLGSPTVSAPVAAVGVEPGDALAAPVFLGELAATVAASETPVPAAGQFVYVRSLTASIDLTPAYEGTGPAVDEGLLDREIWVPQDPNGGTGLIREDGQDTRLNPEFGGGGSPNRYAVLAALPTDPQQLLDQITDTAIGAEDDPAFAAFTTIRDVLAESLAPPATTAALYRAAALVPGIELVSEAQDAAGRPGTGIALERAGQRTELVFGSATGSYLGTRSYFVDDSRWGPAGTLTGLSAVLARGVSDTAGQVPTGADLLD